MTAGLSANATAEPAEKRILLHRDRL